ncbi:putative Transmembrane 4 L6 family member 19 [Blattamonas nauphoetae]|uniref:Transmembrane 4 L6 family member 19 n=1 Tax=Blattamonas nauphoetae TaxID=2049346 RepID=A0ABQ9YF79_9EUKA|nr:putative Transmembrane 4 L6 family member 19 [Blattamonas nauphoetae]
MSENTTQRLKKFRPQQVKDVIHKVLHDTLQGKEYDPKETPAWSHELSDTIRSKLKELDVERYKYCVQVMIGEQKGEGVRFGFRALWDEDSDNFAQDTFVSDTLFCVAVVFGTYFDV